MTVGQRIAQKRKELALSQEALGEKLGVSRQAIYKWESDAALPEIEKLIALSRLFSVSVGWLLGVEEEPAAQSAGNPAAGDSGELTQAQLSMVEEIVSRYIAARPTPRPRKKWPYVLAAAIAVLWAGSALHSAWRDINGRVEGVSNNLSRVEDSLGSQINGISTRVEEILKAQNDLTAEYGTEIRRASLERNSVTFSVYAEPKTFTEGMTVTFTADNGNGSSSTESQAAARQNGEPVHEKFSAEITCELTDSISISAVFTNPDGTRETQLLDTYSGLYTQSFPQADVMTYGDLFLPVEKDGTVHIPEMNLSVEQNASAASAVNGNVGVSELQSVRAGLFRNQKLVAWAESCEKPGNFHGDGGTYFRMPATDVAMTGKDELCVAAVLTDNYGRQWMAQDIPYIIGVESGQTTLTWPAASSTDSDPAHWTY